MCVSLSDIYNYTQAVENSHFSPVVDYEQYEEVVKNQMLVKAQLEMFISSQVWWSTRVVRYLRGRNWEDHGFQASLAKKFRRYHFN
jgi:hypothetical protein